MTVGCHGHDPHLEDALRQALAHGDLARLVQQRDLHPLDLVSIGGDDREADLLGLVEVGAAPVAGKRRIEHFAQPMNQRRPAELGEHATIDARVVVGFVRDPRQLAAGHDHDPPALRLHELALFLICGLDLTQVASPTRLQLIRVCAADDPAADRARLGDRPPDQILAGLPAEPHPALGGVHGLGDPKPVAPDVAAESEGSLPIDPCAWIRNHVGGGVGNSRPGRGTA